MRPSDKYEGAEGGWKRHRLILRFAGSFLFAPFCMNDDVSSVEYSFFSGMDTAMEQLTPPSPVIISHNVLHLAVTTPAVWFIQIEDLGGVRLRGVG